MRWVAFVFLILGQGVQADPAALAAINAERADNRRNALTYDTRLEAVARAHGQDMARNNFFAHSGSDGSDIAKRLKRGGYRWCFAAENIAVGQRNLGTVMAAWMASPGHRRNILNRKAQQVGLARVSGNRWVMVLAAPC